MQTVHGLVLGWIPHLLTTATHANWVLTLGCGDNNVAYHRERKMETCHQVDLRNQALLRNWAPYYDPVVQTVLCAASTGTCELPLCYIIPQITIGLSKAKQYLMSNTFVFWVHRTSIIVHFKCQVTSRKAARSLERLTDKTLQTKTAALVLDNTLTWTPPKQGANPVKSDKRYTIKTDY